MCNDTMKDGMEKKIERYAQREHVRCEEWIDIGLDKMFELVTGQSSMTR